jgi:hypothetical protein
MSSRTLKGNRFSLIALFKFSAPALHIPLKKVLLEQIYTPKSPMINRLMVEAGILCKFIYMRPDKIIYFSEL